MQNLQKSISEFNKSLQPLNKLICKFYVCFQSVFNDIKILKCNTGGKQ